MAYSFVGVGTRGITNILLSATPGYPTGILAGDILILASVVSTIPISLPAGWTYLINNPAGGGVVCYKVATGNESGTITVTGATLAASHQIVAYRGLSTTPNSIGTINSGTNITTISTNPTTVVAVNGELVISFFGVWFNNITWTGTPVGTTQRALNNPVSLASSGNIICDEFISSPSTTTARTASTSGAATLLGGVAISFKQAIPLPLTNFKTTDPNTSATQDLGQRYLTKSYLLDVYPNIASQLGARTAPGLWSCGINTSGQLGLSGTTTGYYSSPVQVGSLTNWKQVSGGSGTSLAIKTDGSLWTWGSGNSGQQGLGDTISRSSPVQVGLLTNWKQALCNGSASAAIDNNGRLYTWGANSGGALGQNNINSYSSPVQVGSLTNWKTINMGSSVAAIKTDGSLWMWGVGANGNLGQNNINSYSSPVQVGSLTNWKQAVVGSGITIAIKTDGSLWTWGTNLRGELGLGDIVSRSSPVQVGSLTNWKTVSPLYGGWLAIKSDGTLWSCGYNASTGNLGLGDTISRSSPVQVGSLTNWKQVFGGVIYNAAAIKTDGTLWTWGGNLGGGTYGQLGLGDIISRSSPVQVGLLTNWKQVAVGTSFFAIADGYI